MIVEVIFGIKILEEKVLLEELYSCNEAEGNDKSLR